MNIDEEQAAIEVLLCAGDPDNPQGISDIAESTEAMPAYEARLAVEKERCGGRAPIDDIYYCDDCLEAAYRLIESSPTLRREWFGR